MNDERIAFSRRLVEAMRQAGYDPRPNVLHKLFNSRYRGRSVSFQSVSRWLRGISIPEQDKLVLLAKLLGTEPQTLRYGNAASKISEPRAEWQVDLKPHERELVDIYRVLSTQHRKLVREMMTALAR